MIFALFCSPIASIAQTVPTPTSKEQALNPHAGEVQSRRERQRALEKKLGEIDSDLSGLRGSMVRLAAQIRRHETEMSKIEAQINALEDEKTELQRRIKIDQKKIATMASALVRLRDVPPEALIARPGAPLETAQTAMILRDVMEPLQTHARALRVDLEKLAALENTLKTRQKDLKTASEKILDEQKKLANLLQRREKAYASLRTDLKTQEDEIERLAAEASDFRDFLSKLEDRNRDLAEQVLNEPVHKASLAPMNIQKTSKILASLGAAQIPISGVIKTGFGALDDFGSASQGIHIVGRPGALVVAPMKGIVRYRGKFKDYGNLIIIEHAKNQHSLVAGLARIDTVVGQSVVAGEPLGTLGATNNGSPMLYYELRLGGRSVDPVRLFADAG